MPLLPVKLSAKAWTAIATVVACALVVLATLPVVPVLLRERVLAEGLQQLAQNPRLAYASDSDIRKQVQQLARKHDFFLGFEDVFVQYAAGDAALLEPPVKLGYALPMSLPVAGVFPVSVSAVRVFDVRVARPGK